ncbi:hypothetical protein HanIR_Chr05g0210441 [Helianthus annuus]|nr:hypothetical protein HanIR_Chr05g0210441 [Helianthus annuus]
MISVASGSIWRDMGVEVEIAMKTWSRRFEETRGRLVISPQDVLCLLGVVLSD